MKTFCVYLREIRVVPVLIEAETIEEAEKFVLEGDGEYRNDESRPSDLSTSDYLENLFEKKTIEVDGSGKPV